MTVKLKMVWAVIALVAVAAGTCPAQDRWVVVNGPYGQMRVRETDVPVTWRTTPVTVDGEYAEEHPEQRGLQAVVVDVRDDVSDHEVRIGGLERRASALESTPYQQTTPPPAGGVGSYAPAQSLGGNYPPAIAAARGVVRMDVQDVVLLQRALQPAPDNTLPIVGGLLLLGALVWIAINTMARAGGAAQMVAVLMAALNLGDGEVRGSATGANGESVAFRIAGINAQARAAAIANAQAAAAPTQGATPVAPPVPPAPAQPAQQPAPAQPAAGPSLAAMAAARAGLQRALYPAPNLAVSSYVASRLEAAGVDLNDPTAVDGVVTAEQTAGNI